MHHLSPYQFRFPRSHREAFGVEHSDPLPCRVTFLGAKEHHQGDALVGLVAAVVLIGLIGLSVFA